MATHISEDDLTLYYYGEGRRRASIQRHLDSCSTCAAVYRDIAGTLAMIAAPEPPERGDQYGLEVWQRIRHQLPEREHGFGWFGGFEYFAGFGKFAGLAAAAAVLMIAAFLAGTAWRSTSPASTPTVATSANPSNASSATDPANRILLASVADHLERTERVLTEIMNAPASADISTEQQWADDLVTSSRLYRQDAVEAGEQSIASILDDLERNLLDIVHSPSKISAADLDQIRKRIDAAALLFKVRVMSDELRRREEAAPDREVARPTSTKSSSSKVS